MSVNKQYLVHYSIFFYLSAMNLLLYVGSAGAGGSAGAIMSAAAVGELGAAAVGGVTGLYQQATTFVDIQAKVVQHWAYILTLQYVESTVGNT